MSGRSTMLDRLPEARLHTPRCGPVKRSRSAPWRAAALIAVHVVILVHVAHWKIAGSTVTPLEPSEAMQTLELGYVNAGFLLFALALIATLVLGRFFCGWLCHVVAYQDLCAWILGRVGLRPKPVRSRLLVLVPLGAALYMFVWPTVERAFAERAAPALAWHLTTTRFWDTFPGPLVATITILIDGFLVVCLLGAKGFCTYGCPYGGLFGVVDRLALGKIRVTDACEGCGHCTATCTSNVRVHEEVRLHRMVVDAGCMKCLDCVSVCPKSALYFGFGLPTVLAAKAKMRAARTYDVTWPEEIAMAVVFWLALYAFRGLYDQVPFLLAIGLAVMMVIAVVTAWRLVRRHSMTLQHVALRRDGRLTRAGRLAALVIGMFAAFGAHSACVQYHAREGERLLLAAERLPRDARAHVLAASLEHLLAAGRIGLCGDGPLEHKIGSIVREQGNRGEAERRFRQAIALAPCMKAPRLALADLLILRGATAEAKQALAELLAIDPGSAAARQRLPPYQNENAARTA
ncbi:MAG: 4Fe-4S binding protein [Planctomycetota bacterium]